MQGGCIGLELYCNTTVYCIAGEGWEGRVVSQYNLECCSMRQSCLCHKTGSCVATQQGLGRRRALGRTGVGVGRAGRAAGRRGSERSAADARAAGARGAGDRARQQARAHAERAGQGWLGDRLAAWALGERLGPVGWPWAVHSACFWPGSTQHFPESNFLDIVREPGL